MLKLEVVHKGRTDSEKQVACTVDGVTLRVFICWLLFYCEVGWELIC